MSDPTSTLRPPATMPPVVPPVPMSAPGDSPGVQERINALNARNAEMAAELATARAAAAQVATYQRQAIEANRRADAAHIPALRHPDVSAHVSGQYDAYASRAGDTAKTYADWLSTDAVTHRLVSPYLAAPVAAVTPGTATPPTPAAPPPNPSATTLPNSNAPPITAFSRERLDAMTQDEVRANLKAVIEAGNASGDFRYVPPTPRT